MPLSFDDLKRINGLYSASLGAPLRRRLTIKPFGDAHEQSQHTRHPLLMRDLPALHAVEPGRDRVELRRDRPLQRPDPNFDSGKPALQRGEAELHVAQLGTHRHDAVAEPFEADVLFAHITFGFFISEIHGSWCNTPELIGYRIRAKRSRKLIR